MDILKRLAAFAVAVPIAVGIGLLIPGSQPLLVGVLAFIGTIVLTIVFVGGRR